MQYNVTLIIRLTLNRFLGLSNFSKASYNNGHFDERFTFVDSTLNSH
jgi:hypothetical protein